MAIDNETYREIRTALDGTFTSIEPDLEKLEKPVDEVTLTFDGESQYFGRIERPSGPGLDVMYGNTIAFPSREHARDPYYLARQRVSSALTKAGLLPLMKGLGETEPARLAVEDRRLPDGTLAIILTKPVEAL